MRLTINGLGRLGEGMAEYNGMRVFVSLGIPGEEVLAQNLHQRGNHINALVTEVLAPSPLRVEPSCPYFGHCTGCQWQHINYEHQLAFKWQMIQEAMEHVARMPNAPISPVVAAPEQLGYRNHARFTVGQEGALGFVNRYTRRFVRVDRCLLMHPSINDLLSQLQGNCEETTQLSIRHGTNTGQWLLQPTLRTSRITVPSGQKYYEDILRGKRFRVSAASFFQVNTAQAEQMAQLVIERLALTGQELVVDAYAGVGTFALLIAPFARKVIAIEDSAAAVEDARVNIQGISNVELLQARTEEVLQSFTESPDVLVLDPPRTGCHPSALKVILSHPPKRLVYVSCDPWALARDLEVLCHGPFILDEIVPIDLFPQTHHIECIATLSYSPDKEKSFKLRQDLILASTSPRRKQLLESMGIDFQAIPSNVEEPVPGAGNPIAFATQQAKNKAEAVASRLGAGMVIGADTIIADGDEILGKPASDEEAQMILTKLRGREHQVITGIALVDAGTGEELSGHRISRVRMREYSDQEISDYISSGEASDKAGAYGIQDTEFHPVAKVQGCYLNVVGLPPCTLIDLLGRMGVHPAIDPNWKSTGKCRDCRQIAIDTQKASQQ